MLEPASHFAMLCNEQRSCRLASRWPGGSLGFQSPDIVGCLGERVFSSTEANHMSHELSMVPTQITTLKRTNWICTL